ncbi:MAG: hypothetical protein WBA16_08455 [Nonlabens sp.]
MKTASAKEVRDELKHRSPADLMKIILRLSRFKKENKELLTYLLFESDSEESYVENVKELTVENLKNINHKTGYHQKKSVRKVLRELKKYIRYSGNKETEVELLIHFCSIMRQEYPKLMRNRIIKDIVSRQAIMARVRISTLHEDLQHDYEQELNLTE